MLIAAGLLVVSANTQNQMARAESVHTARSAIRRIETSLKQLVRDHAGAGLTVARLLEHFDPVTSERHLAGRLAEHHGVDVILLQGVSSPRYAAVDGQFRPVAPQQVFSAGYDDLIARARRDGVGTSLAYLYFEGTLHLAAAAAVTTGKSGFEPPASRPVLLFADQIEGSRLARIAKDYSLADLRLSRAPPAPAQAGFALPGPAGGAAAYLGWQPPRPGAHMLRRLALPLAGAVALVLGLAAVVLRRGQAAARALDGAARELAERNARLVDSEARAREARLQSELSNRSKSEFLATMSHELRTPLNAIIGFAEILEHEVMGPLGNRAYREYAHDIRDSGGHLLDLINDILDLSKAEAGKLELHEAWVDLGQVAQRSLAMLRPRADEAEVTLSAEVQSGLPRIWGDERKLKQTLINLATNAVKFTPAGGRVAIRVHRDDDGGVELAVADTGIGISPDDIKLALQPFGQVHPAHSRRHTGTGLGLAIVQSIVKLHGGAFTLDSAPGEGTTACIRLPAARCEASDQAARSSGTVDAA